MRAPLPLFLAATLLVTPVAFAADDHDHEGEKRELGSHEHGHVVMKVAVDGDDVQIALEAPGESIVGFEHAPKTDEQKAKVAEAEKQLGDPAALFTMTEAAGCSVKSAQVELHQEGTHNEFEGEYAFACSNIAALTSVETSLFKLYPAIEEVDVEYATPAGQGSGELEADKPVLDLPTTS